MKRRETFVVCCVQGALVLEQEVDHRHGAHSSGPVDGVLPPAVSDPG